MKRVIVQPANPPTKEENEYWWHFRIWAVPNEELERLYNLHKDVPIVKFLKTSECTSVCVFFHMLKIGLKSWNPLKEGDDTNREKERIIKTPWFKWAFCLGERHNREFVPEYMGPKKNFDVEEMKKDMGIE